MAKNAPGSRRIMLMVNNAHTAGINNGLVAAASGWTAKPINTPSAIATVAWRPKKFRTVIMRHLEHV